MFDMEKDRFSYGELLRPQPGFTLDGAVGTTYSLDLEAMLGVPVSLGLLADSDPELMRSPLYVLEAIRKSSHRIALFCQSGRIQLPQNIQSVYALLENSVFQVQLERNSNFHPKVWLLKYSNDTGGSYMKLIVLSRNLTFDSSIDVCVSLQGPVRKAKRLKHKPIADFLQFLRPYASPEKQAMMDELADAVLHVARFEVDEPFADYQFHPMGIPGHPGADSPLLEKKSRLFVVSPFLSDNTIRTLADHAREKILITRKSSVTQAALDVFDHVYVTRDLLSDNEFRAVQDIHAKLYLINSPQGNRLYLGSANASSNAFYHNVECMLELKYSPSCNAFSRLFRDFFPDGRCPYEELTVLPEQVQNDPLEEQIDQALQDAAYALRSGAVHADGPRYSITLQSDPLHLEEPVCIAPLYQSACPVPLTEQICFSGLLLKELSTFFVLSIGDRKIIKKVELSGMPEERDQAIYRGIINTKAKFLSYLSFALSDDYESSIAEHQLNRTLFQQNTPLTSGPAPSDFPAVYEHLLKTFHKNPHRLLGIRDMVRRLDPEVVGPEFEQILQQFITLTEKRQNDL